ncbi:71f18f43-9114-4302-9459-ea9e7b9cdc8a [Sclerotinia trifoliorum]|uniref:71f18f43-9114-4302-9459-ea9e7b9cdc8a n=1 Tax=Sclerotinia trifoliorum TaxID=28548 RepID=A0A8H2W6T7_9HELO|nr:71f18f43-9114-4302-9459-ea9e7b9cdc8a [Sclerotinia trifoliorum]
MKSLLSRYQCVQSLTRRIFWDSRARVVRLQSKGKISLHRTMASRSEIMREQSLVPASPRDLEPKKEKENESGGTEVGKEGEGYLSHIERTATEPRDESLHTLFINSVTPVNSTTRLFYLSPRPSSSSASTSSKSTSTSSTSSIQSPAKLTWKPGQWIDLYLPGIEKPGGFSITNVPPHSSSTSSPPSSHSQTSPRDKNELEEAGIELAIQKPTQQEKISKQVSWLFQPPSLILNQEVKVRIGGSFTLPSSFPFFSPSPSSSFMNLSSKTPLHQETLLKHQFNPTNPNPEKGKEPERKKIIFIAGGMGINPLISMLTYIHSEIARMSESDMENTIPTHTLKEDEISRKERTSRRKKCLENLEVKLLYSTKAPSPPNREEEQEEGEKEHEETVEREEVLFLPRLHSLFTAQKNKNWDFQLFITSPNPTINPSSVSLSSSSLSSSLLPTPNNITIHPRRISPRDIELALSFPPTTTTTTEEKEKRKENQNQNQNQNQTITYICGPPALTDEFTSYIQGLELEGMDAGRIVCERWW